jgi:hypothetical protein
LPGSCGGRRVGSVSSSRLTFLQRAVRVNDRTNGVGLDGVRTLPNSAGIAHAAAGPWFDAVRPAGHARDQAAHFQPRVHPPHG